MILRNSLGHSTDFINEAIYFGIALQIEPLPKVIKYHDPEVFFLSATQNLKSSRLIEGFLCWLLRYGYLLSPSKIRRLITSGNSYDPAVLGGFLEFLIKNQILAHQYKILSPYAKKKIKKTPLLEGPIPKKPNAYFLKYNLVIHNYLLDSNKFLLPKQSTFKTCIELRNRALFGSTVNADVASYLSFNPVTTPYLVSKNTNNHKASVFKVFRDLKIVMELIS
jgi:hypothetical protein